VPARSTFRPSRTRAANGWTARRIAGCACLPTRLRTTSWNEGAHGAGGHGGVECEADIRAVLVELLLGLQARGVLVGSSTSFATSRADAGTGHGQTGEGSLRVRKRRDLRLFRVEYWLALT